MCLYVCAAFDATRDRSISHNFWICFLLQLSFEVGITTIFGGLLAGRHKEALRRNYSVVEKGYNCFPNGGIPGTLYYRAVQVRLATLEKPSQQQQTPCMRASPVQVRRTDVHMLCMQARKKLREIVGEIVADRRARGDQGGDLLGGLMRTCDGGAAALTDDEIADNVIGVLFAAQDTTASVLTWILKYLRDYPKLLQAVKVIINFTDSSLASRHSPPYGSNIVETPFMHMAIDWCCFVLYTDVSNRRLSKWRRTR